MDYTIIDNGKDLLAKLDQWNGLERIAVDFEGEFNLHIYGEHLCLIQVYDGKGYYIIDPRANAMGKEDLTAFFESDVKKVHRIDHHCDIRSVLSRDVIKLLLCFYRKLFDYILPLSQSGLLEVSICFFYYDPTVCGYLSENVFKFLKLSVIRIDENCHFLKFFHSSFPFL